MLTKFGPGGPVRIMLLTCSTRPGALGPAVSRWFERATRSSAQTLDCEVVEVSLAEVALPLLDEPEHPSSGVYQHSYTQRWSETVAAADGFVVVLPEYNYGMPAPFKNALDHLYDEWAWKPMGFVSYGNTSAGTRSVQHAKQVTTTLRLVCTGATVALRIADAVTDGVVESAPDRDDAAAALLTETVALSRALRPLRTVDGITVPAVPGAQLRPLTSRDAGDVVVLQRCCWLDEARANDTLDIPALQESVADVERWLDGEQWRGWGVWLGSRLIAMVRTRQEGSQWEIGRLGTVPDARGRGVASWLLEQAERKAPSDCVLLALHTGRASAGNIRFYTSRGYHLAAADSSGPAVLLTKGIGD